MADLNAVYSILESSKSLWRMSDESFVTKSLKRNKNIFMLFHLKH